MSKKFFDAWQDLLIVGVLLFAGWKFTHGLESVQDILLYDETYYLQSGLRLLTNGLPHAESAPLFALWYFLLSFVRSDPIALYYLNFKILTTLLPVLLYVVLRRYRCPLIPSALMAFVVLISAANLATGPKVAQFALLLILSSFFLASFAKTNTIRLAILALGALLASYARPELFFTFVLMFLLCLGVCLVRERRVSNFLGVLVLGALSLVLITTLGVPPGGSWRSAMAFGQHFSVNWVSWTNNTVLSPWNEWQKIMALNFGEAQSIPDAARANPPAFVHHLVSNVLNTPATMGREFFRHANLLLPYAYQDIETKLLFLILVTVVLGLYRQNFRAIPRLIRSNKTRTLAIASYLAVSGAVVILIYPADAYLLVAGVMLILLFAPLVAHTPSNEKLIPKNLLGFALVLLLITPPASNLLGTSNTPNANTIQTIRALKIHEPVRLFDTHGDFSLYLGDNFHFVDPFSRTTPFDTFSSTEKINMLLLDSTFQQDGKLLDDRTFQIFLKDYPADGFTSIPIPGTDRHLLIKTSLLPTTTQ